MPISKMPSINATNDELRNQSARGAEHGASPGSADNIGGRMGAAKPAMGGGTAGLKANPSRVGNPPISSGAPGSQPTADSVRTHSLALGGMKHMVAAGHIQPHHAKAMEAKSRAHIAAYKGSKGAAAAPTPRRFGALGGSLGAPATGAAGMNSGGQAPNTPSLPTPPERNW